MTYKYHDIHFIFHFSGLESSIHDHPTLDEHRPPPRITRKLASSGDGQYGQLSESTRWQGVDGNMSTVRMSRGRMRSEPRRSFGRSVSRERFILHERLITASIAFIYCCYHFIIIAILIRPFPSVYVSRVCTVREQLSLRGNYVSTWTWTRQLATQIVSRSHLRAAPPSGRVQCTGHVRDVPLAAPAVRGVPGTS